MTGTFQLRSAQASSEYFDEFQFTSRPDLLDAVTTELAVLVPSDVEVLVDREQGGHESLAQHGLEFRAVFTSSQLEPASS